MTQFTIAWIDGHREPQCAPDPAYPEGIDIPGPHGDDRPHCKATLPYPGKRCGYYAVICDTCGSNAIITTAGRPDDPRSVAISCEYQGGKQ